MARRSARTMIAVAAAACLTLAACGQGENPADADAGGDEGGGEDSGDVELRFTWWGADLRHRLTQETIDAFEAEHPGITVTPEYTDWNGYWDRLATTAAAGDLPDIIQMDEKYLRTYAEQGSLLDLSTLEALDTGEIDPGALPSGEVDGGLYGLVTSVNAYSMITNATLLEQAGIEAPDDSSWTWEEFAQTAQAVTEGTDDDVWGMQGLGIADGDLNVWARQVGDTQWTAEGTFGVSQDTLSEWWQYVVELAETGAMPPPAVMEEKRAAGQESSAVATNTAAFGLWWSNQYAALSESSGDELLLLRPPRHEAGGEAGLYYKPSMFWSAAADTEHPEEVALFLDFLANSPDAGEILLVERGVPSNLAVREHVTPLLDEAGQTTVAFIDDISDEVGAAPAVTPQGASEFEPTLQRHNLDVLFGNLSPQDAAAQLTADTEAMIE